MSNGAELVNLAILGVLIIIVVIVYSASSDALKDPNNNKVVYLEQLPALAALSGAGEWQVVIYRQSGNVHSAMSVRGDASFAIQTAMTTMRRAKIDAIAIQVNEEGRLKFTRLFHNHRGRNEGKKVGGAEIKRV